MTITPPQQLDDLNVATDATPSRVPPPRPLCHSIGGGRRASEIQPNDRVDQRLGVELTVVVPVYNEATLIAQTYARLTAALRTLDQTYEIIFVNDGSNDGTAEVLRGVLAEDPRLTVVQLATNTGQQQATLHGLRHARGDVVITLDADVQAVAADIRALLAAIREDAECDVASGERISRSSGLGRSVASRAVTAILNRLCGARLKDPGSTVKAMRRSVVEAALADEILAQNLPLFVAYKGMNIREVPLSSPVEPRRSRYQLSGLVMALTLALLNYSSGARTLSVLLLVGGTLVACGFGLSVALAIVGVIRQQLLPTNLLLAALLSILFGGQFLAFSFLGFKLEALMRNLRLRATGETVCRGAQ